MSHWKQKETKQQPDAAGPVNILGCCLVSLCFLCTSTPSTLYFYVHISITSVQYTVTVTVTVIFQKVTSPTLEMFLFKAQM